MSETNLELAKRIVEWKFDGPSANERRLARALVEIADAWYQQVYYAEFHVAVQRILNATKEGK